MSRHPLHQAWLAEEASRPTLLAPEMRAEGERCISTSTGLQIGRCHVRKPLARVAGSVSGPHRRPGIASRALGAIGSMRALWVLIALCAAALLLSACGPTDAEALRDAALDLQDAQQQARAERRGEIHQAQALAMLAASGRK